MPVQGQALRKGANPHCCIFSRAGELIAVSGGNAHETPKGVRSWRRYPRVKDIIEQDLSSGLVYLNSHTADFKNPDINRAPPSTDGAQDSGQRHGIKNLETVLLPGNKPRNSKAERESRLITTRQVRSHRGHADWQAH